MLDNLRNTDDTDKQTSILKTQARTCFKGPSAKNKQNGKAMAKAKAKPASRPQIRRAFTGQQFTQAEFVDRKCFVYPNGSPVSFITEDESGYEGGVA